jgi:outer membrane protein insertion porin family
LSERESFGVGLGVDYTKITTYEYSPQQYIDFANDYGSSNTSFPLTLSWTRDGKNSYIFPTSGAYQRIGTEIALPGGDLKYWKLNYKYQHYTPLNKTFTFMYNLDLGIGNSYGGQNGLPFYKNYYAGGIDSVRGYADGSLGPSDSRYDDEHVGGSKKVVTNLELLWGVPGYGQAMRMGWFFDAGQVYSTRSKSNEWQNYDDSIRTSTGLSLSWISPVGPLKFSIAHPLNAKSGDDTQTFQFQLGSTF